MNRFTKVVKAAAVVIVAIVAPWISPHWVVAVLVILIASMVLSAVLNDLKKGRFTLLLLVACFIYGMGYWGYSIKYKTKEIRVISERTEELWSLRGYAGPSGDFLLGVGQISPGPYYIARRKTEDGGFQYFTIKGDNITLYEDIVPGETPYIVYTERDYFTVVSPDIPKWVQYAFGVEPGASWPTFSRISKWSVNLHLPEGTMIERFEVDL